MKKETISALFLLLATIMPMNAMDNDDDKIHEDSFSFSDPIEVEDDRTEEDIEKDTEEDSINFDEDIKDSVNFDEDIKNSINFHENSIGLTTEEVSLLDASQSGDLEAVKNLIKNKVNLEVRDPRDCFTTPLIKAVMENHDDVAEYLVVNCKVNLETKDGDGRTALAWAVIKFNKIIIKLLVNNGANIDTQENNGATPLANQLGDLDYNIEDNLSVADAFSTIKFIIKRGANPDEKCIPKGQTMYHKIVRILDTDRYSNDSDLKNDVDLCCKISSLLGKYGAKTNIKDKDQKMPFELATINDIRKGFEELAKRDDRRDAKENDKLLRIKKLLNSKSLPFNNVRDYID